jgi:hypothetical protein
LVVRAILSLFNGGLPLPLGFPLGTPIYLPAGGQDLITIQFPNLADSVPLRVEAGTMANLDVLAFGGSLGVIENLFPAIPPAQPHLRLRLSEELLIQKSLEKRWRELVRTVAPEAARQEPVFNWLRLVIMQAISVLDAPEFGGAALAITWDQSEIHEGRFPAQFEQSLALIASRQ